MNDRDRLVSWAAAQRILPHDDACPAPAPLVGLLRELSKEEPGFTLRFALSLSVPIDEVWPTFVPWMLRRYCTSRQFSERVAKAVLDVIYLYESGNYKDKNAAHATANAAYAAAAADAAADTANAAAAAAAYAADTANAAYAADAAANAAYAAAAADANQKQISDEMRSFLLNLGSTP